VLVEGQVYGSGTGRSKQTATKLAAQDALDHLENYLINGKTSIISNE